LLFKKIGVQNMGPYETTQIEGTLNLNDYPEPEGIQRILLGPGPSMVHPRVLQTLSSPLVGHLDPYFLKIMERTQALLRYVFQTSNRLTLTVSGTGSAAMETAIANFVEPGMPVLVCINGFFGSRLAEMARRYGGNVEFISRPWGEVFAPEEVKATLEKRPAKVVALVHAETSTGALQPLDDIIKVVHRQGGVVIVDAVTSLGGLPVNVDERGIDICYSGSQKCLGVPPGLGPITVNSGAEEMLRKRKIKVSNWYLDLMLVQAYWGSERIYHHTAPISMNFALYEGLRMVAEEGLEARYNRHLENARLLWDGLEELGLQLLVPLEFRLPSLTTVRVPEGIDEAQVRAHLLQEYNIEIAGGLGELKGRIWRIGLMGYSSRKENIILLLGALQRLLYK
jgi:alanine-glyoxylate transaminase/serine-glyoxylate transaminase/serine-pyruvate transaminase